MNKDQVRELNDDSAPVSSKEPDRKQEDIEEFEHLTREQIKAISKREEFYSEVYDKKIRNLQIISLATILVITLISPLNLLFGQEVVEYVAVGFITASLVPSLIAIFGFIPGRKISLYISTGIYGIWIISQTEFFPEDSAISEEMQILLMVVMKILLMVVLIIYFEVTRTIQLIEPILEGIISLSAGGVFYHANVALKRCFKFMLRFTGVLLAFSLVFGIIGLYALRPLQSDIIFSIFMIVLLMLFIIISRWTLTPDMAKILQEKERERIEKELAIEYSRFS